MSTSLAPVSLLPAPQCLLPTFTSRAEGDTQKAEARCVEMVLAWASDPLTLYPEGTFPAVTLDQLLQKSVKTSTLQACGSG